MDLEGGSAILKPGLASIPQRQRRHSTVSSTPSSIFTNNMGQTWNMSKKLLGILVGLPVTLHPISTGKPLNRRFCSTRWFQKRIIRLTFHIWRKTSSYHEGNWVRGKAVYSLSPTRSIKLTMWIYQHGLSNIVLEQAIFIFNNWNLPARATNETICLKKLFRLINIRKSSSQLKCKFGNVISVAFICRNCWRL